MTSTAKYISLSQLLSTLGERIADAFPLPYWVMAEISELKVNYSGHCYMELVEKGGSNQVPKAKINAVIWRSSYGAISSYFKSATGSPLDIGMKVLVKVSVTFHELYGLSLNISDIDPSYTLGEMKLQREATIEQLRSDGVYDMNRMLEIPYIVQRIAVISSVNAAGYQDYMNELAASAYRFEVTLFDAFMQGNGAEESIIAALERVAGKEECFDMVAIIRGGGSQSDLSCFDSYRLCSHIAQFPLPIVTGIGHDKDNSVADLVAALSLKTPTAVAAWFVDSLSQADLWFETAGQQIAAMTLKVITDEKSGIDRSALRLKSEAMDMIREPELRLERCKGELSKSISVVYAHKNNALSVFEEKITIFATSFYKREGQRISMFENAIFGHDPARILSLGFAIVRNNGKAVKDSRTLFKGDRVDITLNMGVAKATID